MENQGTPHQENTNPQFQQQFSQPFGQQQLPNATAVLVLGIISIVGCFCYGIIGLILGIIALVYIYSMFFEKQSKKFFLHVFYVWLLNKLPVEHPY